MLRPDKYFKENEYHFPLKNRSKARILFRRAVRDFYVMQSNKVIDPITGFKVESVMYGKFIKKQKSW